MQSMARKTPLEVTAPRTPQDLGAAFFMFLLFFSLFAIVGYGYTVMLQQIVDMSQSLDDRQQQEALLAPASGIFLPAPGVRFLTMMKEGDPITRIVNVFGDTLAELVAPADGMFFGLWALPNVQTGDWCCFFCMVEGTRD